MTYSWWQQLISKFGFDNHGLSLPWNEHRFVVVDLELTGLNPKEHEVVSLAWVVIEQQRIKLHKSGHLLHGGVLKLDQSPIYHGITEQQLADEGLSMADILARFSQVCQDSVLVFHNSLLDTRFLNVACKQHGIELPRIILDTLKIEQRRLARQGVDIAQDSLSLQACRQRYELPVHTSHDALSDALATAEFFMAQANHMSKQAPVPLSDLITAG
ncbi:exonuclease domain-containing protein [Pseudoalteromonas sp. SSDWG2]|uniref:3'-5' exonuclease n=1 Tax=Pseudoalteromonas sp. SSDWG2 TaxID=3139391 RepID=UPI003BAA52CE